MKKIETDDPKLAARYYQLCAEFYEGVLRTIGRTLGYHSAYMEPDLERMKLLNKGIQYQIDNALVNESMIEELMHG